MELLQKALEFEQRKMVLKSTTERILAAREAKSLILALNEVYKETKNPELMDLMKRLTVMKQKAEKRLR